MLKNPSARLEQYVKWKLPYVPAGFRKGRGMNDETANIHWIIKKAREYQKNIYFCFTDYDKSFDCVNHNNCGKFFKRWEYQTTLPDSWVNCMQVKRQQLELDMEQQTGSKLEKEYIKAIYCHPAYLTYMESTSSKMLAWKHKLKSRLPGEILTTLDMQMTPPLWQKEKRN